jgi:hypothetical protein
MPQKQWSGELPLGELRTATGTAETWFLAFFHAGVASQEALLTELFGEIAVVSQEGPSDALHTGPGLARVAAAVNRDSYVDTIFYARVLKGREHRRAVLIDREKVVELSLVDRELALTGANANARDGGLAAAGSQGINDFFGGGRHAFFL